MLDIVTVFFDQFHDKAVVVRGISGTAQAEGGHLYFVPDAAAIGEPAYQDDVARLGGEWERWNLTEDLAAQGEMAQQLGIREMVITLPDEADVGEFARWLDETLLAMGLG